MLFGRLLSEPSINFDGLSRRVEDASESGSSPPPPVPAGVSDSPDTTDQIASVGGEHAERSGSSQRRNAGPQRLAPKRKLLSGPESQATDESSRKLRSRLDTSQSPTSHTDGSSSNHDDRPSSQGGSAPSADEIPSPSISRRKRFVRSKPDRWDGRFSHNSILSDLCPDVKDEIERKCNQLLSADLADFLGKHTKSWKTDGFWEAPLLTMFNPTNTSTSEDRTTFFRYVEAMQAEEETHYLKLRMAKVLLLLQYVREVERQRRAGCPVKTAKSKAIDTICGANLLGKEAAGKKRMSFHEHKRFAERWWWAACFFGCGFLLGCSQETGNKVLSPSLSKVQAIRSPTNWSTGTRKTFRWMDLLHMSHATAQTS